MIFSNRVWPWSLKALKIQKNRSDVIQTAVRVNTTFYRPVLFIQIIIPISNQSFDTVLIKTVDLRPKMSKTYDFRPKMSRNVGFISKMTKIRMMLDRICRKRTILDLKCRQMYDFKSKGTISVQNQQFLKTKIPKISHFRPNSLKDSSTNHLIKIFEFLNFESLNFWKKVILNRKWQDGTL